MKKTLIALMALASVAMADTVLEYDFTGTSPWSPTIGSGSSLKQTEGWSIADGNLTYSGDQGQYKGLYNGDDHNRAIYANTTLKDWDFTIHATITLPGSNAGLAQFFGENFATNRSAYGLYVGKDGSYGIKFSYVTRNAEDTANITTYVTYSADLATLQGLGVSNTTGVAQTYGLSYVGGNLSLTLGGVDITSALTWSSTNAEMVETSLSDYYKSQNYEGFNLKKFGYANEIGVSSVASGSTIHNVKLIPEPATATLSLLALAGLAARRRRR